MGYTRRDFLKTTAAGAGAALGGFTMIRRLVASGGILVAMDFCQGTVSADEINVQWLAGK